MVEYQEDTMKCLVLRSVVFLLLFMSCTFLLANDKKKKDGPASAATATPATAFPAAYTKLVDGATRFENPDYFSLMASDGIKKTDAKSLYARLQAAVAANERYKALYLARVLTQMRPENAAMWANRAQLATALGLTEEAAICQKDAEDPAHIVNPPLTDVLPGQGLAVKPATLADWAAATALLSDGVAEKAGKQALVAFKDSVSGIHEATAEEVQENDNDAREAGLPPPGPWARPEPVQVAHVLGNVFSERGADPMHFKSMNKGGMFGAMVMAGLAGANQNTNPALAQQGADMAQQMAGQASNVPSHYKDGSYTRVTYAGDKEVDTPDHPLSAGLDEALGTPVPFLWASGGSTEPAFKGAWKSNQKTKTKRITPANLEDMNNAKAKRVDPPDQLQFPKLMGLCVANNPTSKQSCTQPLTLLEVLLTPDDVGALAPSLSGSLLDTGTYRNAYGSLYMTLTPGNGGGSRMWGVDGEGAAYPLYPNPTSWVVGE
jgi:hypothetical protein